MVYSGQKIKPCHVVLNDIKGLLDSDGYYVVPGRSRRALTCYRCFKKFYSAEALEVHKAEHEPESGEEDVYAISDSEIEIEIESESDEEEKEQVVEPPMKRNSKSPNQKRIDPLMVTPKPKMNTTEQVSKISELSQPKQVQVVEPIMGKPKINVASASPPVQSSNSAQQSADDKKLPVLCNIQIRCLSCDVLFTNSELLMHHKSVDVNKPCCFTCKVCTASYSQPADYLTHIMQHNTFSSSRYGYRGGHRRRPEFRCTYCQKEFEHRFLLKQHEDTEHKKEIQPQVTPEVVVVEETIAEIHPPPKPIEIAPKQRLILPKQENIEVTNSAGATSGGVKPKIWVIKEAMMKSPEPSKPYEQNAVTVASVGSAKRKLDDIETLRELVKPGKRGRPSKAASSYVIMPDERLSTPAVKAFEQSSSLTCDECYDVFETKAAFDEHMVFHGENKDESDNDHDYPCNLCNVRFRSVAGLRRHQTCIHEKMTSFVCVKCSKIFSSRKGLNIHRGSCTGNSS